VSSASPASLGQRLLQNAKMIHQVRNPELARSMLSANSSFSSDSEMPPSPTLNAALLVRSPSSPNRSRPFSASVTSESPYLSSYNHQQQQQQQQQKQLQHPIDKSKWVQAATRRATGHPERPRPQTASGHRDISPPSEGPCFVIHKLDVISPAEQTSQTKARLERLAATTRQEEGLSAESSMDVSPVRKVHIQELAVRPASAAAATSHGGVTTSPMTPVSTFGRPNSPRSGEESLLPSPSPMVMPRAMTAGSSRSPLRRGKTWSPTQTNRRPQSGSRASSSHGGANDHRLNLAMSHATNPHRLDLHISQMLPKSPPASKRPSSAHHHL
jgi:hypothetical protein